MERWEEADELLAPQLATHPTDHRLATVHALNAHSQGLYREAVERWGHARRLGAREPFATARLAASLRLLGELPAAQTLVDDALRRFPRDVQVLTEAARLAQARDRPHDAVALWDRAMLQAKPRADWLHGLGLSLLHAGDLDRAASVLTSARRRHPDDLDLLSAEGWIATARQDWPRSIAAWTAYRRRSPSNAAGWEALGNAVHNARMSQIADDQAPAPLQADIAVVDDEPMRDLMLGFESLGDSCEVGLVQRRFGAEPLGLLRWNDVRLDDLIAALDNGFDGMGEPGNTEMLTAPNGELYLRDRRWNLTMHLFLIAGQVADPEKIYAKMCRRVVFLRDKLLEDFRTAAKIFVYHSSTIDEDGLRRLHRALLAYGPVTLLGVQPLLTAMTAFRGRAVGDVERLDEGLYVGFLGHASRLAGIGASEVDFDTWATVLTKARDMMRDKSMVEAIVEVAAATEAAE